LKPDIAIIIPVLNESGTIHATLEELERQSTGNNIEIIVVDADPDAATLLRSLDPERWSRLQLKTAISDKGRGIQMNRGAELASGPVLLFLHADTLLPEGAIDAVLSTLRNQHIVGGAFDLGIRSDRWGYRIIENIASARSRITRLPYGDQAIFLRKDYFHMIGGFSMIPIMEDVDIMQRIKKRGDTIEIIDRRVQTDPRRWEKGGIVYGTFRNWVLMMLYLLGVSPHKLVKYYEQTGFEGSRVQGGEGSGERGVEG
jgi:rSAM/selenodomain-associated transferase 2